MMQRKTYTYPHPCSGCGIAKEKHEFVIDMRTARGHRGECKPCFATRKRLLSRLRVEKRADDETVPSTTTDDTETPIRQVVAERIGVTKAQYCMMFLGAIDPIHHERAWTTGDVLPAAEAALCVRYAVSARRPLTFADCGIHSGASAVRKERWARIKALAKQGVGDMSIAVRMAREGHDISHAEVRYVLQRSRAHVGAWDAWGGLACE